MGFWATTVIIGGSIFTVNQQVSPQSYRDIHAQTPSAILNSTAMIIRRFPDELPSWQEELADHDIKLYLAESPESIRDSTINKRIRRLVAEISEFEPVEKHYVTRLYIAKRESRPDGSAQLFVLDMPSEVLAAIRNASAQISIQFFSAMLLSGIACFILARYFTRNLENLTKTSKALAAGHLSERVKLSNTRFKDELTTLADEFNQMAEALERSMDNQRRLVRDISHELRSPLTRLQIALELAQQNPTEKYFERIALEADRLNDMIGQLLSMPSETTELNDTIEVDGFLHALIQNSHLEADTKGIKLTIDNQLADKHTKIAANTQLLFSAVENVLRNAIRYSPKNGTINLTLTNSTTEPEKIEIYISDQGKGIPDENLADVFSPFFRVDDARDRNSGGYGIGLAITYRVITAHKGRVSAKNNCNGGLTVSITLPILSDRDLKNIV